MKVLKLTAQNTLNLKAVEINFDENMNIISGENGAGKSAVMDALEIALAGKKVSELIRKGEDRAEINVDLGDNKEIKIKVRRIITPKADRLEVFNADGDKKSSPAEFLSKLIGAISFDPLSFSTMKKDAQRDLLKKMVGIDFADLEKQKADIYEERTGVNAKLKAAMAEIKTLDTPSESIPSVEISFKDEMEKFNQLRAKRDQFILAKDNLNKKKTKLQEILTKADDIKDQIAQLYKQIDRLNSEAAEMDVDINNTELPESVSTEDIRAAELQLEEIDNKNIAIRNANRYRSLWETSSKLKKESDDLTEVIDQIDQEKINRITSAKFPINGLSINDEGVIFNGMPFDQLSEGQKIRVSTAIAMKLNPTLKFIAVRDGSLLDKKGKEELFRIAAEQGYQILMEEVAQPEIINGAKVYPAGIYIEEGDIKAVNGKAL